MSDDTPERILEDLEEDLEALDFVEWDRWTGGEWSEGHEYVTVYGWIDRDDEYKDFVEIIGWDDGGVYFTTSSAEYTEEIYQVLFDEPLDEHNDCRRVENVLDIENMIEV